MEPKLPAPNLNPERAPQEYGQNIESLPLPPSPEVGFERGERPLEQKAEATPAAAHAAPMLPTPISLPHVSSPAADDSATSDEAAMPLVANDDDLIEKEWVDKAKKIIAETRDDPHRREQEVGRLQADYLRKRYGKELGATE